MLRTRFVALAILAILWSCASVKDYNEIFGHSPDLLDSFAVSIIAPGDSWKVYVRAKDEDGDMKYITAMFKRPGRGFSPTSQIPLEDADRADFTGYLELKTPSNDNLLGRNFRLQVVVHDKRENRSAPADLPLVFNILTAPETIPAQWQAATKNRLGGIMIDLATYNEWRWF